MMNLHKLSDPVSDFWKCPKKGFKKKLFMVFLVPNFTARHVPPSPGVTHVGWVAISCSSLWRRLRKMSSLEGNSWCRKWRLMTVHKLYCTVLYCIVLYCGQLSCLHVTSQLFLREGSLKKNTHIWASVPTEGGSEWIPTSLTLLAKWQRTEVSSPAP